MKLKLRPRWQIVLLAFAAFAHADEIDAEIIRHLDFFQDLELLENMDALGDAVSSADETALEQLIGNDESADTPSPAEQPASRGPKPGKES